MLAPETAQVLHVADSFVVEPGGVVRGWAKHRERFTQSCLASGLANGAPSVSVTVISGSAGTGTAGTGAAGTGAAGTGAAANHTPPMPPFSFDQSVPLSRHGLSGFWEHCAAVLHHAYEREPGMPRLELWGAADLAAPAGHASRLGAHADAASLVIRIRPLPAQTPNVPLDLISAAPEFIGAACDAGSGEADSCRADSCQAGSCQAGSQREPWRERWRAKGPHIDRYAALRRELNAEPLLLDFDGTVLETATCALLAWHGPAVHTVASRRRVHSVTEQLLLNELRDAGVTIRPERCLPRDWLGAEVWAVNALHGIRVVRSIDGEPTRQAQQERLHALRRALAGMRRVLPR